ncbi:hypothetical protein V1512DRAFT_223343 [Lipomyces arxii]|uniref:mitochondrial 54S ribosomal protein bL28m n=1 Tax=Lipomyces arxii TaxID=56418 RepID=UPI0034CEA5FA
MLLLRPLIQRIANGQASRPFSSTSIALKSFKLVVSRKVKQKPALPTNFWVKQHLKTGRKIKYPPYPYGDSHIFKRSNVGLYGGKFPIYGNMISEKLENKHRRRWLPNIVKTTLQSRTLKARFRLNVATSVLKTIKNEGGLDEYLIKDKPARIKQLGPRGWRLRYAVLLRLAEKEKARLLRANKAESVL